MTVQFLHFANLLLACAARLRALLSGAPLCQHQHAAQPAGRRAVDAAPRARRAVSAGASRCWKLKSEAGIMSKHSTTGTAGCWPLVRQLARLTVSGGLQLLNMAVCPTGCRPCCEPLLRPAALGRRRPLQGRTLRCGPLPATPGAPAKVRDVQDSYVQDSHVHLSHVPLAAGGRSCYCKSCVSVFRSAFDGTNIGDRPLCAMAGAGGAAVQQRQRLAVPGGSARSAAADEAVAAQQRSADGGSQPAAVTNASLKLLAWLADYAALTG
jgi:hypothetical protein